MYGGDLDKCLAILINHNPNGLNSKLKQDFYEWSELSKITAPKQYPTIDEIRTRSFEEAIKFKETDLYPDCNLISYQLAYALNLLNEPGFDSKFVEELKVKQTLTFIERYKFPEIQSSNYKLGLKKQEIPLNKSYQNIKELVSNSSFETLFVKNVIDCCGARITEIIHDNKVTGYVGVLRNNGSDDYRITLNNKTLIVETLSSIIE